MPEYRVQTSVDEDGDVRIAVEQRDGGAKWGRWETASAGLKYMSSTLRPPAGGGRRRQEFFEWRIRRAVKNANDTIVWLKKQDAIREEKNKKAHEALAKAGHLVER